MICCGECQEANTVFCKPCDAERVFIFDVDGTLTPSRGLMNEHFASWFIDWAKRHSVYLVTGSDYPKTVEQLGYDVLRVIRRSYNCNGNDVWQQNTRLYSNIWVCPQKVIGWLADRLDESGFSVRTGKHFERRPGMLNFSMVGRNATKTERKMYIEWDKNTNERRHLATSFNRMFPDLQAVVGGETGLDIMPIDMDKSQLIKYFTDKQIVFVGDAMQVGGNDYSLANAIKTAKLGNTYETGSWQETWQYLKQSWDN